jgi:hypothetical protein
MPRDALVPLTAGAAPLPPGATPHSSTGGVPGGSKRRGLSARRCAAVVAAVVGVVGTAVAVALGIHLLPGSSASSGEQDGDRHQQALEAVWVGLNDPDANATFFMNLMTNDTSWELPDGAVQVAGRTNGSVATSAGLEEQVMGEWGVFAASPHMVPNMPHMLPHMLPHMVDPPPKPKVCKQNYMPGGLCNCCKMCLHGAPKPKSPGAVMCHTASGHDTREKCLSFSGARWCGH